MQGGILSPKAPRAKRKVARPAADTKLPSQASLPRTDAIELATEREAEDGAIVLVAANDAEAHEAADQEYAADLLEEQYGIVTSRRRGAWLS